jgi:hypothetical protein
MSEHKGTGVVDSPASSALLFRNGKTGSEDRDMARLLDFFAIPWKSVVARDWNVNEHTGTYAIVSSVECMASAIHDAHAACELLPPSVTKASTVYVYGFRDNEQSIKLLRFLTGDPEASVRPVDPPQAIMTITGDHPGMCGPMSGMRVPVRLNASGCVCDVGLAATFQSIVRADQGEVFLEVTCAGVRFFLNMWCKTLDIGALAPEYFDVKKFFCEAVPPVFFLKWAFRDASSSRRETSACLIVDDPPLKRRYGFLDFREALDLMERHDFTTTVAFIPWNWSRSHPATLRLFRNHPERLSLVVHGCDHTGGEFAVRSPALLNRMIRTAGHRMESFRRRTSIEADRVMVFPQGQFSPETGRALKLNGFSAVVNTEVAPTDRTANQTTIADLWSVAIMRYGTFPIFTRRYLHHGIENFAFDALLGKPCLIAAHHDVFRDRARNLVDLIGRLNSLRWNLVWRPLGEAVRRSFAIRRLDDGANVIRMFAGSLVVENTGGAPRKTLVLKEEGDPDSLDAVLINEAPGDFSVQDGYLRVWLTTFPGQTSTIRVVYRNDFDAAHQRDASGAGIKVAAKRYLSEFRDNYLSRNDFIYQSANRLKQLMK